MMHSLDVEPYAKHMHPKKRKIMLTVHPQYITDTAGKKLVVLPANEFDTIIEELEELEDIRLYDEPKNEDDGERMLFTDYLKKRRAKHD
jgi:hypothetical protein